MKNTIAFLLYCYSLGPIGEYCSYFNGKHEFVLTYSEIFAEIVIIAASGAYEFRLAIDDRKRFRVESRVEYETPWNRIEFEDIPVPVLVELEAVLYQLYVRII